ncbi:S-layer homology domain-containing protein [Pseudobacteroides cellulosolvens]|uniref:S-layer domain-containing protein n=1 Tax=Pseudobacteroides cellulosolvens ATCC 35603 = DSM 2933 TaxID=398512 RepID=A0A0L6JP41_9FIRM|nr:S-layer homology domain-containing protein [Pseudobacteroides cellulosolvens]KNY27548.1 S-layer domain-containing protein [Pseudobacteroides cellulosolvens ATCC 35603 = DSM 2933]
MKKVLPVLILSLVLVIGAMVSASEPCTANCSGSGCNLYADANSSGICDIALADSESKSTPVPTPCPANCKGKGCNLYTDANGSGTCDLSADDRTVKSTPAATPCPANCKGKGCNLYADANGNGTCDLSAVDKSLTSDPKKDEVTSTLITFKDIANHWSKSYVERLANSKILSGYPDGTIKPNLEINRIEAVVLALKAAGIKPVHKDGVDFADKASIPSWSLDYIEAAVQNKIITSDKTIQFKPLGKISRQELAVILVKAFELESKSVEAAKFKDMANVSDNAKNCISIASGLKIITGYPDTTFKPNNNVLRAEAFTMISRALDLNADKM